MTLSGERFGGLVGCAAAAPTQTTATRTVQTASLGASVLRAKKFGYLDFPVLGHGKTPSAKATIVERYLMMQSMIKHQFNFGLKLSGTKRRNRRRRGEMRINDAADEQGYVEGRNVAVD